MRAQVIERGQNPEDFPILASKPDLWPDLVWIWEAFTFLTGGRQIGFNGPQPIALAEVLAFCEFRGIYDPDEREELLYHIQRLDALYLGDYHAKTKKT